MSYDSYVLNSTEGKGTMASMECKYEYPPSISVLKLRPARLLLAHRREIDGLAVRQHQLVLLIVHETVLLLLPLLLVALDPGLVRVLAPDPIRIDVSVLAARYAIHADRLLLVRAVVVLKAPRDGTVRVVVSVSPDNLEKSALDL